MAGHRKLVPDAVADDALDGGVRAGVAVPGTGPGRLRMVGEGRRLAQSVQVGPLLDLFTEVRVVQRGVRGAVPQLHARVATGVPGVHGPRRVAPLLRGLDEVAVRARVV